MTNNFGHQMKSGGRLSCIKHFRVAMLVLWDSLVHLLILRIIRIRLCIQYTGHPPPWLEELQPYLLIAISGYKYPLSTQETIKLLMISFHTGKHSIWLEWQAPSWDLRPGDQLGQRFDHGSSTLSSMQQIFKVILVTPLVGIQMHCVLCEIGNRNLTVSCRVGVCLKCQLSECFLRW